MEYAIIFFAAFVVSMLTLFSGFGLGTILMPVFAIFFPIDVAIALTAVIHFLNNIFKLLLMGKYINKEIALKFGVPAVLAASVGAWILVKLAMLQPIFSYHIFGNAYSVMPIKIIVALLMLTFALAEFVPRYAQKSFDKKYIPLGGIMSGFFGGLSGHQGALRSAFLIRSGISKEQFIATGVVISCFVDLVRISIYSTHLLSTTKGFHKPLMITALCAFAGAFVGNRIMRRITLRAVQIIVGIMLIFIALSLGTGLI